MSDRLSTVLLLGFAAAASVAVMAAAGRFGPAVLPVIAIAAAGFVTLPTAASQAIRRVQHLRKQLCWWHGLVLLSVMSGLVFRIRDTQAIEESAVDGWAAYRILLSAFVAFVLVTRVVLGKTSLLSSLFRGVIGAMSAYCLISAVSTLWSVFPSWTLYKSGEYFVDIALLAAITAHITTADRFRTLFNWTWILLSMFLASVWIGAVIWPDQALIRGVGLLGIQICGVYPSISANGVGTLAGILALVAFVRIGRAPVLYSFVFLACLVTLALSQTRSAIIGLLVGIAVVLVCSRRINSVIFTVWLALLLFSQTSAADVFWKYFRRGQNEENFRSLSGRINWWEAGLAKYSQRPLTGYGAYTSRFTVLDGLGESETSSIHNTFLEVLFGAGPFALAPLVVAMIWACSIYFRAVQYSPPLERALGVEAFALFALQLTRSCFSSTLVWHPDWPVLCVIGYAEFLRRGWVSRHSRFRPVRSRVVSTQELQPHYAGAGPS